MKAFFLGFGPAQWAGFLAAAMLTAGAMIASVSEGGRAAAPEIQTPVEVTRLADSRWTESGWADQSFE